MTRSRRCLLWCGGLISIALLGLGMLINPTEWLQNEEIRLKNVRPLEQAYFVGQLRSLVESSPSSKTPFSKGISKTHALGLEWPAGVLSLSHVALPFPPDDPLYGRYPPADRDTLFLGQ